MPEETTKRPRESRNGLGYLLGVGIAIATPVFVWVLSLERRMQSMEIRSTPSEVTRSLDRRISALEFDNPPGNAARQARIKQILEDVLERVRALEGR